LFKFIRNTASQYSTVSYTKFTYFVIMAWINIFQIRF